MNNKNIELVTAEYYPHFPQLVGLKNSRIFTKHFTNCALYLSPNRLALLNWLVYQSRQDNTVRYNTHLLRKYRESVIVARDEYGPSGLLISLQSIRNNFSWLIKNGFLLKNEDKFIFTINPMLTYRSEYLLASEYKELAEMYEAVRFGTKDRVEDIGKRMSEIINGRIKSK